MCGWGGGGGAAVRLGIDTNPLHTIVEIRKELFLKCHCLATENHSD